MAHTIRQALTTLLAVCDGANEKDGAGFNGFDAPIARDLASIPSWSYFQEQCARKMLAKYKGQLSGHGVSYKDLKFESQEPGHRPVDNKPSDLVRIRGGKSTFSMGEEEYTPPKKRDLPPIAPEVSIGEPGKFYLRASYDQKDWVKENIPGGHWNGTKKVRWYYIDLTSCRMFQKLAENGDIQLTPSAQREAFRMVSEDRAKVAQVARIKDGPVVEMDVPLNTTLYDHQHKAFQIGVAIDAAALLMEQGTGKTLAGMAIAGHRYLAGQVKRLLVVCPKSVTGSWAREFQKFAQFPHLIANLGAVRTKKKARMMEDMMTFKKKGVKAMQVVLVNYESVWSTEYKYKKDSNGELVYTEVELKSGKIKKEPIVVEAKNVLNPILADWDPDMIILDESQNIKSHKTNVSHVLHKVGDETRYKLILSGTPVTQSPLDLYSQYRFLNPHIFGKNFSKFRDEYAVMGGYGGFQVKRYKNLEDLADKAHSIAYRVTKDECLDLPPFTHQIIEYDLDGEQERAYHAMLKDMVVEFFNEKGTRVDDVTAKLVITQMGRLQQITGGFLPIVDKITGETIGARPLGSQKLKGIQQLFEDLPAKKKIVVFAKHREEIAAIEQAAKKAGRKSLILMGGTKGNRQDLVDKFQDPKDPHTVFIAQIATGGVGLTLTAADTVIFYSKTFSYAQYAQALARVHRISQTKPVTYIHLVVRNTIDEDVLEALTMKGDISELVVDVLKKGAKGMKIDGTTADLQEKLKLLRKEVEKEGKKTKKSELPQVDEPVIVRGSSSSTKKDKVTTNYTPVEQDGKKFLKKETKVIPRDSLVTLKELATELGVEDRVLRKKLRKDKELNRDGGRWEWASDDPHLEKIRAKYGK